MTRKVLVADTPEGDRRISAILTGHEVVFERTLREAQRALAGDGFDLVLIGVHFDDSRMFDLLRHLQGYGHPVVCMRSQSFASPAITVEGLEIAAGTLGCRLFLDLTQYPDDAQGNAAIRKLLDGVLAP